MPASLQFALSNPVAGMEKEYNEWYGSDHLANGVLTPGVLAGQRFGRVKAPWPAGKHDYMVIWEFDDPAYALEQLAKTKGSDKMPISPAIDMAGIQPPTMWLRASAFSRARVPSDNAGRRSCVLALANPAEGQSAQFEDALLSGGLDRLANANGVRRADLLTLADEQIRNNARKYAYALLIELADEAAGIAALEPMLPALPHLDRERWMAPVYRPLGPRLTTAHMQPPVTFAASH
ncbi:MAG: hypothetical protein KF849_02215 [Rhizobiaceae bacterium]|nr:hypothetical protein [Rhizobiaceae bacterium]